MPENGRFSDPPSAGKSGLTGEMADKFLSAETMYLKSSPVPLQHRSQMCGCPSNARFRCLHEDYKQEGEKLKQMVRMRMRKPKGENLVRTATVVA